MSIELDVELTPVCLVSPDIPDIDSLRLSVLRAIRLNGGLTDNDLYPMYPNRREATVRARRWELVRQGLVRPDRADEHGRTVWVTT